MKIILCVILLLMTVFSGLLAQSPRKGGEVSERARQLHRAAFVFDAHLHFINRQFYPGGSIGDGYEDGQVDLPRMKEGGVDAFFLSLFVTEEYYPGRFETRQTLRLLDAARRQIARNSETIEVALTAADITRINRQGKIAAVLDLEGGFDLDGDLALLRTLNQPGLRVVQLPAHNWANEFADSCCAAKKWGGLNEHGRAVIREMNHLGMVINISHASDETIAQALEISADPLVATHHGLRSLNDIPRTMPDDLLRKLAARGGVIGFHIGNEFHNRRQYEWLTGNRGAPFWDTSAVARKVAGKSILEIDQLVKAKYPGNGSHPPDELLMSVDDWVGVVDRAIQLVGEDHVAPGNDFDGGPTPPRGVRDIRDLAMITDAMLRRGYTEQRIRKFLGGNLLRVFRQVTEKKKGEKS
ncbi:MAG: dipeptidase [Blastocatellia bacterium]